MRTIAIYLPQFHRIPENDEWWGEGFTEWTNVKKAFPIYEGHKQPRIPINDNFYDLSDRKVLLDQMNLAKAYGIDGFCFYHYWFKGKKLLEKPIEKMLEEKELPIQFMLCWANEPWTRTWDGKENAKTVLLDQNYGNDKDWKEHYYYLNDFFHRSEYIKVDGRPVVGIYNPGHVERRKEMFELWNSLAMENGFDKGLFIINAHRLSLEQEFPIYGDGVYDFEPFASALVEGRLSGTEWESISKEYRGILKNNKDKVYRVVDYSKLCKIIVSKFVFKKFNHYLGFFTGWDNTPRRGIDPTLIVEGNSPEMVEYYFDIQYRRSLELENDFLFINAWNEWGEGAILEPEKGNGFGYLEGIKRVIDKYEGNRE